MLKLFKERFIPNVLLAIIVAMLLSACVDVHKATGKVKAGARTHADLKAADKPLRMEGIKIIKDVAYGQHKKQAIDIYAPEHVTDKPAPIIMMLHGGGWVSGDKGDLLIYINKVNRWVPKGFIVISVGTRLMPDADVYSQIEDLSQAVSMVQKRAAEWGGDASKLMLMGHSSAGTMVSVLAANPDLVIKGGGQRWLASFSLDGSSLDIPRTMRLWQPKMFSYAYGQDDKRWPSASPINLLNSQSIPLFLACSVQRQDSPCEQANLFAKAAEKFNIITKIVEQNLNHGEVNDRLGLPSDYTETAEAFMASLDEEVARRLDMQR